MEYMWRRRSLSNDRYTSPKSSFNQNKSVGDTQIAIKTDSRNSERRKTVPIHFINLTKEKTKNQLPETNLKLTKENSLSIELPDPPSPSINLEKSIDENKTPEAILTTQILQGILETDF